MLEACQNMTKEEKEKIVNGIAAVQKKVEKEEVEYSVEKEDIHMNIEKLLLDELGTVGGKLHTGRSRNDQVATDFHLYVRKQTENMIELLTEVQRSIVIQAEAHTDTIMPGYTHLQRAQPVLFAHHLL